MNDSIPLHWSFDYNHGAQKPDFAKELIKLLHEHEVKSDTGDVNADTEHFKKHVYQILPNFWRGYKRRGNREEALSIGTVVIERRKRNDDIWDYNVQYQNTTSGEDLRFQFCCQDECYRPLHGSWHVDVQNSSSDTYSKLTWDGYLALDTEIRLCINDTEITAGIVGNSLPLTCNWALFDVIPILAKKMKKSGDNSDIVLLDDLEQLRPKCKFGFLDSVQSPIPLDGYYLYGAGVLPSYWWVDANGDIALVSSVFETLVLKEKIGGTS
jgi:hypothetical protein